MIVLLRNSKGLLEEFQTKFFDTFKSHNIPIVVLTLDELKRIPLSIDIKLIVYRHAQLLGEREFFNSVIDYLDSIAYTGETVPSRFKINFYEDKIKQVEIFSNLKCKTPRTWIVDDWDSSMKLLNFPVVVKLPYGAGSVGVEKIHSKKELSQFDQKIRVFGLKDIRDFNGLHKRNVIRKILDYIKAVKPITYKGPYLVQEFLPAAQEDTRVTIIGSKAVVFNRGVRTGDWRASGSGNINYDHRDHHQEAVLESFRIAKHLKLNVLAVDFVKANGALNIIEISVSFADSAVADSDLIYDPNGSRILSDNNSPQQLITDLIWK
jgi:hypothetical protein